MADKLSDTIFFSDLSSVSESDFYSKNIQYRLPKNTKPIKYILQITTAVHQGEKKFSGNVKIHFETLENSNHITLHNRQITINEVDLLNSSTSGIIESNVPVSFRDEVDFLIIKPSANLIKGEEYILKISYQGLLSDDNTGFYISSYVNKDGIKVPFAATNFAPHYARKAFPWYELIEQIF